MPDNIIGSLNWDACESCIHRDEDFDCKINGPDLEVEYGDFVACQYWEEGDPRTPEEIEEEEKRERREKLDKYQEKLFEAQT